MNRAFNILVLLAILWPVITVADEPEVNSGSAYWKPDIENPKIEVWPVDRDFYYVSFRRKGYDQVGTIHLYGFNALHSRMFHETIRPPETGLQPRNIKRFGDELLILYSNAKDGQYTYYAETIDREGNRSELTQLASLEYERIMRIGQFRPAVSPDKSKLLLLEEASYDRDESARIVLHVFNESLESVRKESFELPYDANRGGHNFSTHINNRGDIYLVMPYTQRWNVHYTTFRLAHDGSELTEYELEYEKGEIREFDSYLLDDGSLFVGGSLVSDRFFTFGEETVLGLFAARLDAGKSTPVFSDEHETEYEVPHHEIQKLLSLEDHQTVMISQQWTEDDERLEDGSREYSYESGDIYYQVFDGKGSLISENMLERRFTDDELHESAIRSAFGKANGHICFLFNERAADHIDGIEDKPVRKQNMPFPMYVRAESASGSLNKSPMHQAFELELDKRFMLYPQSAAVSEDGYLILPAIYKYHRADEGKYEDHNEFRMIDIRH